jgi:alpha-tubulin suppressor-like RCC1 family protein
MLAGVPLLVAGVLAGCTDNTSPDDGTNQSDLTFTAIGAGSAHTCGLTTEGAVYCWGHNDQGSLGDGSVVKRESPTRVASEDGFVQIAVGSFHTCARTASGDVYCWGANDYAQLGDGSFDEKHEPTKVQGGHAFTAITAGGYHTCGLTGEQVVYCWGRTRFPGGPNTSNVTPERLLTAESGGLSSNLAELAFSRISAGATHVCATSTTGSAHCWGERDFGQLGWGLTSAGRCSFDGSVCSDIDFAEVRAGDRFTCGRIAAGTSFCWGYNSTGQLGNGSTTQDDRPQPVSGGITFSQIVPGGAHTCGIATTGPTFCWGYNSGGQLGNGTRVDHTTPASVPGGNLFVELAVGGSHSCGRLASGRVYCWGENSSGQLGDGGSVSRLVPTPVKTRSSD